MSMARVKTLDQAIDELMKDYESALKEAVEYASSKAVEDIYRYSMTCLEEYYDNYSPNHYDRTDTLWHAILPYSESYNKGKEIISRVGVEYNPFVLEAYISGNPAYIGSSSYGYIDSWYVVDNYLEGIHPATNGSDDPDKVLYYEIKDPQSPTDKMEQYLNQYASTTFHNNILVSFAKRIAKMK
jgi:hypothetical protein